MMHTSGVCYEANPVTKSILASTLPCVSVLVGMSLPHGDYAAVIQPASTAPKVLVLFFPPEHYPGNSTRL